MIIKNNYYILTGGPGSGKTTLIEHLTQIGYKCVPEVGRNIIKEQVAHGGTALPWSNAEDYALLMLQHSLTDYISYSTESNICFFDRGIPDTLGYAKLINISQLDLYINHTKEYRYNPSVFILPPWKCIYETDSERRQDFQLAVETYSMMKKVYTDYGYTLIEVPCMSISDRAEFIRENLSANV